MTTGDDQRPSKPAPLPGVLPGITPFPSPLTGARSAAADRALRQQMSFLPRESVSESAFLAACAGPPATYLFDVTCDDVVFPIYLRRQRSTRLIITFHGLIERPNRPYPRFSTLNTCPEPTVLSICDPSLLRHPKLKAAWYAGEEGLPTQAILNRLFAAVAAATGASRVVFFGTSVGGFAALYYSWNMAGSIAVAGNPQTRVDRYRAEHVDNFRRYCWPNLDPQTPLAAVTGVDLTELYREAVPNTVILLQNATDSHVKTHFTPFIDAFPIEQMDRLLPLVLPWAHNGHQPPLPEVYTPVLQTALSAESLTRADLTVVYNRLTRSASARQTTPPAAPGPATPTVDAHDADLARRLVAEAANRAMPKRP